MTHPYLPDILEAMVARINTAFSTRPTDPFTVAYGKGNYSQVSNDLFKTETKSNIIWFIMPYQQKRGTTTLYYGDASFSVVIASATEPHITQQQREDLIFKPRLFPMYDLLMQEIEREGWLSPYKSGTPEHTMVIRPYWGGGDANGQAVDNLFKMKADAISVVDIKVKVNSESCRSTYQPLPTNIYPVSPMSLVFFKDIEIIVDGGEEFDPVSGTNSISIPVLKGYEYDVIQRAIGQLRVEREPEITIDPEGGFALTGGIKFSNEDSFIIKIKPSFLDPNNLAGGFVTKRIETVSIQQ